MIDSLTCGGAEKSLISLLPCLVKREYDITLMLRARHGLFEQLVPPSVRIVNFPYRPSLVGRLVYSCNLRLHRNSVHSAELYWSATGKGLPRLKDEYDVAIAYQQGFPTFYIADKVSAKKKLCWINTDLKAAGYSPEFCQPFYRKFNKIAVVSEALRDSIVYPDYCKDKSRLIVCRDILNESLIREMAHEYDAGMKEDNGLHITTVGRLVPPKGYDLAIGAAKILKEKGITFRWHFVGGGALYDQLKSSIEDNRLQGCVILEGEKLNPYPYIASADIYVQTSLFEGFGLTIGEAKIFGKPIVSTNFPAVFNQITNGKNGIVVEMTPEAIAEGIVLLIEDETLRTKIVEAVNSEQNLTSVTESQKVIAIIED